MKVEQTISTSQILKSRERALRNERTFLVFGCNVRMHFDHDILKAV